MCITRHPDDHVSTKIESNQVSAVAYECEVTTCHLLIDENQDFYGLWVPNASEYAVLRCLWELWILSLHNGIITVRLCSQIPYRI